MWYDKDFSGVSAWRKANGLFVAEVVAREHIVRTDCGCFLCLETWNNDEKRIHIECCCHACLYEGLDAFYCDVRISALKKYMKILGLSWDNCCHFEWSAEWARIWAKRKARMKEEQEEKELAEKNKRLRIALRE